MAKHAISLDAESELLLKHLRKEDETLSGFIQRAIKGYALSTFGLVVETRIIRKEVK